MFTIEGPQKKLDGQMEACLEMTNDLRELGVEVISYNEKERVIEFALN